MSRRSLRMTAILVSAAMIVAGVTACSSGTSPSSTTDAEVSPGTSDSDSEPSDPDADSDSDASDATDVHKFSVASFLLDGNPNADMIHWWMDKVEADSNGRITFDYFPAESLCPAAETVQCVQDGRADFGLTVPGYTPERFPLLDIATIPFMTDDNGAMMAALADLQTENDAFAAESASAGLRSIAYWPAGALLVGSKQPLKGSDDLRGLRIRATGAGLIAAFEAAGASPVALTAGEMYESVQHGVIDAVGNNMDAPISYKLTEVLDYWTDTGYGHYIPLGLWMSSDAYDSLPSDLQAVIDESRKALNYGEGIHVFGESAVAQCDYILDQPDARLSRWSDAEIDKWSEALGSTVLDEWKRNMTKLGIDDVDGLVDSYRQLLEKYSADSQVSVRALPECAARFETAER